MRQLYFVFALFFLSINQAYASIRFVCERPEQSGLLNQVEALIQQLSVAEFIEVSATEGDLQLNLMSPWHSVPTYRLHEQNALKIGYEWVGLPLGTGEPADVDTDAHAQQVYQQVATVSKREIFLALAHPGRVLVFNACEVTPVLYELGVRQSIVAWSESMRLGWPDGRSAKWNAQYWNKGTPHEKASILPSFRDAFQRPDKYSLGCYTSAKLLVAQGVLDYFSRVLSDSEQTQAVVDRLYADGDPLVNIEPPVLWAWESDFNKEDKATVAGKLLTIEPNADPGSLVPGDWLYFINPHSPSNRKVGYEGSNAIYTGLNRFASFYDPEGPRYSLYEKANDVYQWRHGVFNRPDDLDKEEALEEYQLKALLKTPREGGLLLPIRVVPLNFYNKQQPFELSPYMTQTLYELITTSSEPSGLSTVSFEDKDERG